MAAKEGFLPVTFLLFLSVVGRKLPSFTARAAGICPGTAEAARHLIARGNLPEAERPTSAIIREQEVLSIGRNGLFD